jgi:tRNA (mo5U34)-methyltransferase
MLELSDQQLADFCAAVPWETATRLPDARLLGRLDAPRAVAPADDYRFRAIDARADLRRDRVLEMGCGEGYHTVQLASRFTQVTALEARPRNIACALVNMFVHEATNVQVRMMDVREVGPSLGRFDLVFHSGVLYHLSEPVEHLRRVAGLSDQLLLDTHYAPSGDRYPRADLDSGGKRYPAVAWREGGWTDVFSGLEAESRWLRREALLEALADVGYREVEVLAEYEMEVGPRLALWARR